ncbi:hypothetical protein Tco_1019771 [Tanacetum coccineum]|uniref:Uncharacterized protein n=1 Tax=Tanacetum coccineum TaxID=301880 RepID=A0ABQ5FYC2_9ASTR
MPTTTATVTETTTTTTTVPPPPPQPQQDVSTSILIQTIGQLEQNIADLVEANQALEERLDKQGNMIHQLETQDLSRLIREQTVEFIDSQEIDREIEESVKEVVTASVQHAMRAPLRAHFKDLPTEKFDADKAEERTKKKSKQDSPKTLPGSPPSPPPPPPPSGDQSQSSAALGSSKTTASTEYTAWTTTTARLKPATSSVPEDVLMHEESDFEAQDMGSGDEDSGSRHIPKMDECHKLLTNQVDEGLLRYNVSRPLPLGGPPGQVTIQTEFFFNKDLEYLRFGHKGDRLTLSITKIKAASYPDAGLEQMVPDQMWAEEEYMKRVKDFQLGIESYQTQLNLTKPRWEATGLEFMHDYKILDSPRAVVFRDRYGMQMIMRFNEIHKFSDRTLQQIDEALDYRVKEIKLTRFNPEEAKAQANLPELGKLCWWTHTRRRLQTSSENRMITSSLYLLSYKDGKVRYLIPRSRQSRRDLPRDNPLVSIEVLRSVPHGSEGQVIMKENGDTSSSAVNSQPHAHT